MEHRLKLAITACRINRAETEPRYKSAISQKSSENSKIWIFNEYTVADWTFEQESAAGSESTTGNRDPTKISDFFLCKISIIEDGFLYH